MSENKLQILVVEDDHLDRIIIKKALNGCGIPVNIHFAEDHESGLAAADGKEFDGIFLDYNLPGGTGLELLMAIRDSGNTSPIIIVTSQGDEKIAVEVMKNGANDYIPKSLLSPDGIGQSVRYMVNLKQKESESKLLQKKLEDTKRRLQTVVSNSPIILFTLDNHGIYHLFEGKGIDSLGLSSTEIIGKHFSQIENFPLSHDMFEKAIAGEEIAVVLEIGSAFFQVTFTQILNDENKVEGITGVASDITTHKEAEAELLNAKIYAEQTAKIKEQFLANMSHEIRTPMNGIIGLTRLLLESRLTNEQRKFLQSIKTCSDNLLVIINDILDFSKIEAGKMTFEKVPFRVHELIHHTQELFQVKADEKSISLVSRIDDNVPARIQGDPTRLNQILNNLVSNAIKFTEKGEVSINVKATDIQNNKAILQFDVKDTGIGIPQVSIKNIFESFTQAKNDTSRKFGGTGLGLTIVKKMIELQGGEINVSSEPGKGSTFSFNLTFEISNKSDASKEMIAENTDLDTSHLCVLAAEDNPINQLVIKKLFEKWNTRLVIAGNGLEALERIQQENFDIVLMDIQMPEMDGYTACRKIRTELPTSYRQIPVLAMTAHATPLERQKCYDAGMDDYITKPFDPHTLKNIIIRLTQSNKAALKDVPVPAHETESSKQFSESDQTKEMIPQHNLNSDKANPFRPDLTIENPSVRPIQEIPAGAKINLSYLKELAEGNDAFIIEMIEMFLNKTPLALDEMNENFKKQNWDELRKTAHRIKPSFGYIGLSDTQKALAEIERLSENSTEPDKVQSLMKEVNHVCKSVFRQLQTELSAMK
ncbi:MAG: response regulator [Bacteroidetes bacterium]|nr:MAG: response regulator [Bacteroidota bacterium]